MDLKVSKSSIAKITGVDRSTLYHFMRSRNLMKKSPSSSLLSRMRSVPVREQFTSSITLGELIYGARKKGSTRLLTEIQQRVTASMPVLPFDADAALRYGEVRADLQMQGITIDEADMRMASIALVRGLIVVTGNVRHFQPVPNLPLKNWI